MEDWQADLQPLFDANELQNSNTAAMAPMHHGKCCSDGAVVPMDKERSRV